MLSPVTGLFCHRRLRKCFRKLDASVGASGPHDFAVRDLPRPSCAATASTASRPASVTFAKRPSVGRDGGSGATDLPDGLSEIFFARGLDDPNHVDPLQQFAVCAQARRAVAIIKRQSANG